MFQEASVTDVGPTLKLHYSNVSCLLGKPRAGQGVYILGQELQSDVMLICMIGLQCT